VSAPEPHRPGTARDDRMPPAWGGDASFAGLDPATRLLVRAAAAVAAGSEEEVRAGIADAVGAVPVAWMEEMILQSYLFAGFPRTLNAAREWRRLSGIDAPAADAGEEYERTEEWRARGEATCATVYGPFYERLRGNIRALHPALDAWMIVDGYGKVLGRPGLDLKRRELCVVAACAASRQHRQLHSHLHGAVHAGATSAEIEGTLDAVAPMLGADEARGVHMLWERVRGKE
jgi:4-carboxymuconolactone decarboxylase